MLTRYYLKLLSATMQNTGYYVSRKAVTPISVETVGDLLDLLEYY
jgi:hypothetical protein